MALFAGALAACGGGGGSPGLGSFPPSFFETEEYTTNHGLGELRASSAYAQGASGKGVTVAVIDSGVDREHPEFKGAIAAASIDITSGRADLVQDLDGHGTAVAGVIGARRNGELAHGVAYQSKILAIRADDNGSCASLCTFRQSDVAQATDYAVQRGAQVINYSLGGAASISPALSEALTRAVAQGAVLVLAAGNDGAADPTFPARFAVQPEANGQVIAVGALGADGAIAGFSNRAGIAQDAFLVAPGVNVFAPTPGGGGARLNGTSLAAPHVSGAAALVIGASPFLDPAQVVAILLQSADDLGDPGPDPIYGHGLVNVGAALGPLGDLGVPLGHSVAEERAPLEASSLALGSAFGPGPALGEAILLDAYGRAYAFDLQGRVGSKGRKLDLLPFLEPADPVRTGGADLGPGLALRLGFTEAPSTYGDREFDAAREADRRYLLSADLGPMTSVSFMRGWGLGGRFGLAAEPGSPGGLISADGLSSPYLSLADGGEALAVEQSLGTGMWLKVGLSRAAPDAASGPEPGSRQAVVAELGRTWEDGASLSLHVGRLEEGRTLLDSRGQGAFGLDQGAATSFLGMAARLPVGAELDLFSQASYGLTSARPGQAGLVEGMSDLHSMALTVGVGRASLFAPGDRLALALAQPLRVLAGSAVIDRPLGRTFEGEIVRRSDRVELAPEGREIDVELVYTLPLGEDRSLALNWLSQLEPGHDPDRSPAHALAVRYRSSF